MGTLNNMFYKEFNVHYFRFLRENMFLREELDPCKFSYNGRVIWLVFIDGGLFLQFDDVVNKSPGYGQLIY